MCPRVTKSCVMLLHEEMNKNNFVESCDFFFIFGIAEQVKHCPSESMIFFLSKKKNHSFWKKILDQLQTNLLRPYKEIQIVHSQKRIRNETLSR